MDYNPLNEIGTHMSIILINKYIMEMKRGVLPDKKMLTTKSRGSHKVGKSPFCNHHRLVWSRISSGC